MTPDPDIPESPLSNEASDAEDGIDWVSLISVLWSSRKLIAMVTGIVTVGAVTLGGLSGLTDLAGFSSGGSL